MPRTLLCLIVGEGGISRGVDIFLDFIKLRGGNKMTNREYHNNPEKTHDENHSREFFSLFNAIQPEFKIIQQFLKT